MAFSLLRDIGVDIGTSRTRIYLPNKGIVFDEPSFLVFNTRTKELISWGAHTDEVRGRASADIEVVQIMRHGIIENQRHATQYLRHTFREIIGLFSFLRKDVLVGIPTAASNLEQRTMLEVCRKAGAKNVYPESNALLAALGVGVQQDDFRGWMIVDIGAGLTEVGVISFGGLNSHKTVKIGGNAFDAAIVAYTKNKYKLDISREVAEKAKCAIGSADVQEEGETTEIHGADLTTKLPRTITVTSKDIAEAIQPELLKIIETTGSVFHNTPPEITADIIERGIVLVGGGAQLRDIDKAIKRFINTPVQVASDPAHAVIKGIGRRLQTGGSPRW